MLKLPGEDPGDLANYVRFTSHWLVRTPQRQQFLLAAVSDNPVTTLLPTLDVEGNMIEGTGFIACLRIFLRNSRSSTQPQLVQSKSKSKKKKKQKKKKKKKNKKNNNNNKSLITNNDYLLFRCNLPNDNYSYPGTAIYYLPSRLSETSVKPTTNNNYYQIPLFSKKKFTSTEYVTKVYSFPDPKF